LWPAPPEARGGGSARARDALSRFRLKLALALLLAAALLFTALGSGPLERAEIYFLDGARSMVETGDWLVPRYQGEPFFDKPVLAYWLMGTALQALGASALAARLVPALAALGVLLATARLGLRIFGPRSAIAAAVVLSTTSTFVAFGRIAMSDMLLTLWTTLAAALGARVLGPAKGRSAAAALAALGAVLGLGFATKGPVAWLMAGIPLFLMWWPRRRRPLGSAAAVALSALLMLALAGGWFLAVYARLGSQPLAYFFLRENLERFAGEAYDVGRPFWYYLPAYLLTGLPWSLLLVPALARTRRDDASSLLAAWIGLALLPLSLARGKLDYYLLPLYPAIALLIGRWLAREPWTRFDRACARLALLLSAAGLWAVARLPERVDPGWLPTPGACVLLVILSLGAAFACLAAVWRPTPARVLGALAGGAWAVGLVLIAAFLPAFRAAQPNRVLAEDVRRERSHRPDARVVACADPARVERDVLFEARLAVVRRCDLWSLAPSREAFLFLLRPEEYRSLSVIPGFREVARYRYLPASTLTLSGFLAPPPAQRVVLAANFPTSDPVAEQRRKKLRKRDLREGAE
jgi:4-amino-4-deoxy-L-arabinose transferase-like glycosyltransferase